MAFERVFGQQRVKQIFSAVLTQRRLAHAYLFYGEPGVGKDAMALSATMGLHCNEGVVGGCGGCPSCASVLRLEHPGFKLVLPVPTRPRTMKENRYREVLRQRALERVENPYREVSYSPELTIFPIISINQVRSMKREVTLKMSGGGYRVFLVSHAEAMTTEASNSLLKLLEEPPDRTILFLTTSAPSRLLPTIVSRCQAIRFDLLTEKEIEEALTDRWGIPEKKAVFFARMAGGSLQRAFSLMEGEFDAQREAALAVLECGLGQDAIYRVEQAEGLYNQWDKVGIQEILKILLVWLRDLMHMRLGSTQFIMNVDRMEALRQCGERWPDFDVENGMERVQQAIDFTRKNVYLKLVILQLMQELGRCVVS